jgi:hypothetical protein
MPEELFQDLSDDDRREALLVAAGFSGRPAYLLEKDIWVVWTLRALVDSPFGDSLTFKGGTSLSKAYDAIRRFSEDLDITYDIRTIASDLIADNDGNDIPPNRSQAQRWSGAIRVRLAQWVNDQALPAVQTRFDEARLDAALRVEEDQLIIGYEALFRDYGFVKPEVMVEFGARATGEPREVHLIQCDAAPHLTEVDFPSARPHVMLAERTFWEKATAAHVYCRRQRARGERLSRHWHDLVRLDETEYGQRALADRNVAVSVARHKTMFFRENDANSNAIDYVAAVSGDLQLVPDGEARYVLSEDYARMVDGGILPADAEEFDELMDRCADIQERANARV